MSFWQQLWIRVWSYIHLIYFIFLENYYYFDISFNVIPLWKSVIFFWVFKKKLQKVEKMVVAEELSTVKIIFNHWRKQGQSWPKKVKVYYTGIKNFVQLLETWCTQQIYCGTFVYISCCTLSVMQIISI